MKFRIKEHAFIAKLAARQLKTSKVAIVIGSTIYLYNTTKDEFLNNKRWVKHEFEHIRQFNHHGYLPFIIKYLWESARKGYQNNQYEIEARNAENE